MRSMGCSERSRGTGCRFVIGLWMAVVPLGTGAQAPESTRTTTESHDYIAHYNAVSSTWLEPGVADFYGIPRSSKRGVLTLAILAKAPGAFDVPVRARVVGQAEGPEGRVMTLPFRRIEERNAIYQIADFPVDPPETLRFELRVVPIQADDAVFSVTFARQFLPPPGSAADSGRRRSPSTEGELNQGVHPEADDQQTRGPSNPDVSGESGHALGRGTHQEEVGQGTRPEGEQQ